MPIGDLLAEISGEKSSPQPSLPSSSGLKRKADDITGDASKVTKARHANGSASKPVYTGTARKPSPQPHTTSLPFTNGRTTSKPSLSNGRPSPRSLANGRPTSSSASSSSLRRTASDIASRPKLTGPMSSTAKAPPAKPSPTTPVVSDPSKAPKKGSFAEIMARASKAQQVMGKVGVIQHKATERPAVKKERDPPKPGAKTPSGKPYVGSARPAAASSRDGPRSAGQGRDVQRNGVVKDGKQAGKQKLGSAGEAADKKAKKAATATTGYTGTARPKPNTAGKSTSARDGKPQAPSRARGILAPPKASRGSRYDDDDDDDLDGFIEYDEDDDDPGPRGAGNGYGYDSDGSSDMEAGLTDIDEEERKATFAAIQEDKREQALEEQLKRQKEERRRRWNQGR